MLLLLAIFAQPPIHVCHASCWVLWVQHEKRRIMAIVYYNILLMMAKVFQLNGILASDVASEKDDGKYIEEKWSALLILFFFFFYHISEQQRVRSSNRRHRYQVRELFLWLVECMTLEKTHKYCKSRLLCFYGSYCLRWLSEQKIIWPYKKFHIHVQNFKKRFHKNCLQLSILCLKSVIFGCLERRRGRHIPFSK